MQRSAGVTVAILMLAAACGSASGDASTTTTSATTTSTLAETSTTESSQAVQQFTEGRNTLFEPGITYEYDEMPVTIRLAFQEPGWIADVTRSSYVALRTATVEGLKPSAANIGVVVDADATIGSVEAELRGDLISTPAVEITAGPFSGVQFDVEGTLEDDDCDFGTSLPVRSDFTEQEQWERPQVASGANCAGNRFWLFTVEDWVVVVHITHLEPLPGRIASLDELGPYVNDFINGITFCTQAAPCDG